MFTMREAILNLLDDYIYVSDVKSYEILFLNTSCRKALGLGDQSYAGHLCYKLLQGHDEPCPYCKNAQLQKDAVVEWDDHRIRPGRIIHRKDRILDWNGRLCRMSFARDITDAKMQQSSEHIKLTKALEAAEQAAEARSRFLANVSHELRTPLNAILGFISVAAASVGQPELLAEAHKKAATSTHYLLAMVNDVLDMAHMSNGTFSLAPATFELSDFIGEVCALFVLEGRKRDVSFHPHVDFFPSETLFADSLRVKQLLIALLSNAFKFTAQGGVVHLNVRPLERNNTSQWLELIITDTGRGMSQDFLARMFDPFERDGTQCMGEAGMGLGLPICKTIVDLMGGDMHFDSAPGRGTKCRVQIPVGVRPSRREALSAEQWQCLHSLKLLVVDDTEGQKQLRPILDNLALQADMAENAHHAVQLLDSKAQQQQAYDACIVHGNIGELEESGLWDKLSRGHGVNAAHGAVSMLSYTDACTCLNEHPVLRFVKKPYMSVPLLEFLCSTQGMVLPQPQEPCRCCNFLGKRLLLVEDNELNRQVAFELLSKICNFTIDMAENGREAVTQFQQHPAGYYDVVLMDISMPVLDGHAATKEIRALAELNGHTVPIVALSANTQPEDKERSLQCGINEHLAKPLDLDKLCPVLTNLLG